jgi:hypothetical protein
MRIRIPSPAVVIASLALLVSLSGTAVAGVLITGAQMQNNTVGSLDLKNNDVKSIDVLNNSLTSLDLPRRHLLGNCRPDERRRGVGRDEQHREPRQHVPLTPRGICCTK